MDNQKERKRQIPKKIFGAEFTLAIGCRLNCKYCPQEKLVHKYTELFGNNKLEMSFEDFKTCLSKIEKGAGISIGGMVEPFHNKDCAKMIQYAYEEGYHITFATSLEGATEEDYRILKNVDFADFILHIPDAEGNSKFSLSEEYLVLFKKFNKEFPVNAYSCHGEVHESVRPYLNPKILFSDTMMDRAGNLENSDLKHVSHTGPLICGNGTFERRTGWTPDILPNGTVVLCCMDYGMDHILGNILEQDWDEIFEGKEYLSFEEGLDKEKSPLLCRKCSNALSKDALSGHARELRLMGGQAIKIARLLKAYESGEISDRELENRFNESDVMVIKKLVDAEQICVFGLGKLFKDNYFNSLWYNVIQADAFSDNNEKWWDQTIRGVHVYPPNKLGELQNLLVVTYVNDDAAIKQDLEHRGIKNILNINDIFNLNI